MRSTGAVVQCVGEELEFQRKERIRSGDFRMGHVTDLLVRIKSGDDRAAEELLPVVYDELRRLASHRIAKEAPGISIQGTELVHEAYLRLVGTEQRWEGNAHFFAAAAEAMRRILVEHARARNTQKRGGDFSRIELHESAKASTAGCFRSSGDSEE